MVIDDASTTVFERGRTEVDQQPQRQLNQSGKSPGSAGGLQQFDISGIR